MRSNTIVFIHGMYMTPVCWEGWVNYFQTRGYRCLAPAWPGRDQPVEVLRQRHPDPELGRLTLSQVVDSVEAVVRKLDQKPVLIGHSMGGLVAQLLLQKNLGAAGVAIDPAPPMGVFTTEWPFLRSNWPHITPFANQSVPIDMSFDRFQYTFVNTMPAEDQRDAYQKYVVPESRRVPGESLFTKVDFSRPHPPLLMIAGGADHIIPASLVRKNFNRYHRSPSQTDFKEFPGRVHFIIGQPGWEEVAGYVLDWLVLNQL